MVCPPKVSAVSRISYERGTHDTNHGNNGTQVAVFLKVVDSKFVEIEGFKTTNKKGKLVKLSTTPGQRYAQSQ